jgi:hypothetical protein
VELDTALKKVLSDKGGAARKEARA